MARAYKTCQNSFGRISTGEGKAVTRIANFRQVVNYESSADRICGKQWMVAKVYHRGQSSGKQA